MRKSVYLSYQKSVNSGDALVNTQTRKHANTQTRKHANTQTRKVTMSDEQIFVILFYLALI